MTPQEQLLQSKAELDRETDEFLTNLNEEEPRFQERVMRTYSAAAHYRVALTQAADHVSPEKGEAYREAAEHVMESIQFFLQVLSRNRKRFA